MACGVASGQCGGVNGCPQPPKLRTEAVVHGCLACSVAGQAVSESIDRCTCAQKTSMVAVPRSPPASFPDEELQNPSHFLIDECDLFSPSNLAAVRSKVLNTDS
jgi:hypothetical protein